MTAKFPFPREGLRSTGGPPPSPSPLSVRAAELYAQSAESVCDVVGLAGALDLLMPLLGGDRRIALVAAPFDPALPLWAAAAAHHGLPFEWLDELPSPADGGWAMIGLGRDRRLTPASADQARAVATAHRRSLVLADARLSDALNGDPARGEADNLLTLGSLTWPGGAQDDDVAAIIGPPALMEVLRLYAARRPLPSAIAEEALRRLGAERLAIAAHEAHALAEEVARVAQVLAGRPGVSEAIAASPLLLLRGNDPAKALARWGVTPASRTDEEAAIDLSSEATRRAVLAAFGAGESEARARVATRTRLTAETRIAVRVDLDTPAPREIATGVRFFDHMLDQVAAHGGFSLVLSCEGDVDVDAHHSVEDCAIALGEALREALGDKRGINRFGFVLPMDESRAEVLIDLSGRPYCRFDGAFSGERVGDLPLEMVPHVFRSLSDAMAASLHVRVDGENDHHKVEACFKALGRALRMAVAREGGRDSVPSTKGML